MALSRMSMIRPRVKAALRAPASRALVVTREMATYTDRQNEKGRPVSPHVTIYAFPVVALSSITVRVTGGILAVGK